MATRTVLVDDMDGGDADVTIAFAVNGDSYSIDLSQPNAERFWSALQPYIEAAKAKRAGEGAEMENYLAAVERRQAIREWARKHGREVSARGRIPLEIVEEYEKRHRNR